MKSKRLSTRRSKIGFTEVNRELYGKITQRFTDLVWERILEGDIFKPPGRMGEFQLVKIKAKKLYNLTLSKKLGKKIYYDNFHSDGCFVKLRWNKKQANFKNRFYWQFKLVRSRTRLGENSIKNYIYKNGVSNYPECL